MLFSDDARVMIHPFRVYRELAGAEPQEGLRAAIERAIFLLFVIGAFVSFTTAGRLVAFHVASTMIFWSFVPVVQAAIFAAVLRSVAPRARLTLGLALYFAGHGPWLLFLTALAGGCFFVSDIAAVFFTLLRREPYTLRPEDYAYRGNGLLDRIARAIGWVGLLGLILVKRRRR